MRFLKRLKLNNPLNEKWREALRSVLPVAGLVLLLCFLLVPVQLNALSAFLLGAAMLMVGMSLFNLGTDMAMTPIGEAVGSALTRSRNVKLIVGIGFLVGVMVTVAEPDLTVLAGQVSAIPSLLMIACVALGVGAFLALALWRILKGLPLRRLLLITYGATLLLALLVPRSFLAVAFDAGGVTTGPMTVPFILGLGVGVAAIRSDNGAENDSFGLVALCSIGPILAVMLLSVIFRAEDSEASAVTLTQAATSTELFRDFASALPHYLREVGVALAPVLVFFVVFQLTVLHLPAARLRRIAVGLVYTFVGLVLFLTGVNVGFMPVGYLLGEVLGGMDIRWALIPLGMIIGWFVVTAEPAVQVLCKQVYEMTAGTIPSAALARTLSGAVAVSVGLTMLRVLTGLSVLWLLIPGYLLALGLTFAAPPVFTAIAFDSGGVASGPMTAAFLLPLALGACGAVGGDPATDAFGVVAMVAMTPLIAIQLLGVSYRLRIRKAEKAAALAAEMEIIEV